MIYFSVRRKPPYFTFTPRDVEVYYGSDLNLTCTANGNPAPVVLWKEDGFNSNPSVTKKHHVILQLQKLKRTRQFHCQASSALGVIEHTVIIRVRGIACYFTLFCLLQYVLIIFHFHLNWKVSFIVTNI